MNKTEQCISGVLAILTRVRNYNSNIGNYIEHFINEQFNFTVNLSNGKIFISMTMAQNQEAQPSSVSEDSIQRIANGFQYNNPVSHQKIEQPDNPSNSTKPKGMIFWEKMLRLFGLK